MDTSTDTPFLSKRLTVWIAILEYSDYMYVKGTRMLKTVARKRIAQYKEEIRERMNGMMPSDGIYSRSDVCCY